MFQVQSREKGIVKKEEGKGVADGVNQGPLQISAMKRKNCSMERYLRLLCQEPGRF